MQSLLTPLDLAIFFGALIFAMAVGLIAGRKENTAEEFFLAGRNIPWYGVAGSIFGSNVSANHMVGMMGVGFTIGFAMSHFELGAIFGLLMLCYGFLPVYRKLNVFTLSEYLGRRYDDRSRIAYAIIMVIIMAIVQMVPGLYIGARSMCLMFGGDAVEEVTEQSTDDAAKTVTRHDVNLKYYVVFVIALAVISASYTILGGLQAVVWTDVIQSVLLLASGIVIAILTFQEIGGWGAMMARDATEAKIDQKMHLYLPMSHPKLPWTGVFTGLMCMHCFYWGTNQFIVQRALGARSDREARIGIITAGFLKLLIPFFAIGTGVAASYLLTDKFPDREIAGDAAFAELVKYIVIPIGYGAAGIIAAGLIGAILSSIDSMMNSAATIVTIDIYKKYINPNASDRTMIAVGRLAIVVFVVVAALMAIYVLDPNSKKNFFIQIADYQNYLTPGILVAFLVGMFWKRATATGAFAAILSGVVFSWIVVYTYDNYLGTQPHIAELFGGKLNFFHRVVVVLLLCGVIHVLTSLATSPDEDKGKLTWTDLGGHDPKVLKQIVTAMLVSIAIYIAIGFALHNGKISPSTAAVTGAAWTLAVFLGAIVFTWNERLKKQSDSRSPAVALLTDDRFWAGWLSALAVYMLYYYY